MRPDRIRDTGLLQEGVCALIETHHADKTGPVSAEGNNAPTDHRFSRPLVAANKIVSTSGAVREVCSPVS